MGGGADLRCVHFLVKMYAKTKEIDPVGYGRTPAAPPGSANETYGIDMVIKVKVKVKVKVIL